MLDATGHQTSEVAIIALMEAAGTWQVIAGPGTSFSDYCTKPTPKPIVALMCPDAYVNLGFR
jgi:hypothetical protein